MQPSQVANLAHDISRVMLTVRSIKRLRITREDVTDTVQDAVVGTSLCMRLYSYGFWASFGGFFLGLERRISRAVSKICAVGSLNEGSKLQELEEC